VGVEGVVERVLLSFKRTGRKVRVKEEPAASPGRGSPRWTVEGRAFPAAALFLSAFLACAGCVCRAVYVPDDVIHATPGMLGMPHEEASITTADGEVLGAWWIPARNPSGTVLFCHGNGGNISTCLEAARLINSMGLNVLLFDYRGYGRSTGSPSEEGTYRDAAAAWDYLVRVRGVRPETIVVWGKSLGGAVAARTAAEYKPAAVVIESAFTSIPDLVSDMGYPILSRCFSGCSHDTLAWVRRLEVPLLVIHSPQDEIVPFSHGRVLYDAAPLPKEFVAVDGSHNTLSRASLPSYEASVRAFLSRHLGARGAGP